MLKEATPEGLVKLSEEVLYAAELLGTARPDVISYNCTSSAIMKGAEYEADITRKIADVSGAQGTSMALSITEGLSFLGVKKIAMVCPYLQEVVDAEEKYLESFGFEVVYSETLNKSDPLAYAAREPWENYHFALDAARKTPEAEAVVVSCGAMRTIEIIEYLERAIGKPAVSSNLCTAWNCLRLAGIKEPVHGYGTLLDRER
jgi:maleate isomerase